MIHDSGKVEMILGCYVGAVAGKGMGELVPLGAFGGHHRHPAGSVLGEAGNGSRFY